MTETHPNGLAPTLERYRVGARGGLTAQAFQYVWDRLDATEYRDGVQLATEAANQFNIKPVSVLALMHRMTTEGHLETDWRTVATVARRKSRAHPEGKPFKAMRRRAHYRIVTR